MATGISRTQKEDMRSFERDVVWSTIKDVKKENFSGTNFVSKDFGPSKAQIQTKIQAKPENGSQVSISEKKKVSSVSFRQRLLRTSMAPILSLKRVRITKESTGQFFVFLLRVAALEAVRRVSRGRCPQIWWGLQGISLLQAPPFNWFQRWAPLRHLVEGTQSFSKPLIFLSLATAVSSAVEEIETVSDPNSRDRGLAPPDNSEEQRTEAQMAERRRAQTLNHLKQALQQADVVLPERIGDEELENFLVAANGNLQRFVTKVQKSVNWRQTYYFLNNHELIKWSQFVFWHDYDVKSRPTLVIRLGLAYKKLPADERPRFCQAVVSQVEYGILHLLHHEDPRITVIMDCKGTTAIGFPVQIMKSCSVLVQESYPTRLAALFAINLPPVIRVIANAVMQVVGPVTREKVKLLGDVFLMTLSEHVGGTEKIPACLGGACHCVDCMEERRSSGVHHVSRYRTIGNNHDDDHEEVEDQENTEGYEEDQVTNYRSYNTVLRVAIIGFLILWIMIVMVAGLHEPDFTPT